MTQRIFDVENEKDMADLWDMLPDGIIKISPNNLAGETSLWSELNLFTLPIGLIKINWHDKTEITRPIQEATEADVGKLCKFWDSNPDCYSFGIMTKILYSENAYYKDNWTLHKHCRRLTKQEIEELI